MSVDATAITSFEYVSNYLGASGIDDPAKEVIEALINSVTKFVESYTKRRFKSQEYTEYISGDMTDTIIPYHYPITSVESLYDDDDRVFLEESLIDSSEYTIVDERYIRLYENFFDKDVNNVKIVYTAGYAIIPQDLAQAAAEIVVIKYRAGRGGGDLNIVSKTRGDISTTYKESDIPENALSVLNLYKRIF